VRGTEVLIHNRWDVARRERMQVERAFNGDPMGFHAALPPAS